ncbi:homocysteine-responsive endoplasmic reticulum-resident ubiquitin-like domain member 1 protein [Osmerus mordax]|uniref:homocysteine-responsive endoplasmic reticulum-resident ubiquitin-like domain member 1 protein n=1 Tax=Osmerus mordax TaxID=8014 RepID=UPI00350ECF91
MDLQGFQQKTITLVIKAPNQVHGDKTIEGVELNWTVQNLKTHISNVYPGNPAAADQRLIYAGKLLPDHLHIRDVFRQTDTTPTLHLVCSFRTTGALGARPKVRGPEQPETQPSSSPALSPQVGSMPPSVPAGPELRQRRHPSHDQASAPTTGEATTPTSNPGEAIWPGTATPGGAEMTPPAFPSFSLYSPQQLLWLQHVYARQYYMQYHAALAAAASTPLAPPTVGPAVAAHQAPIPAALPNQNPIDNLPANQNAQDPGFINPGAANQNMRMNAQGGPVMEDEEDVDRDWLDWIYTAARLGVFLSIVYFYSSLSRFVLVMSSLILMYLHTAGWFPFRRRALVRGPNPPPLQPLQAPEALQNQQNPDRNPNLPQGEEPAAGEGAEPALAIGPEGQPPLTAILVPPTRVSVMWTAWVFLKTFFSSLIPEAPQAVVN